MKSEVITTAVDRAKRDPEYSRKLFAEPSKVLGAEGFHVPEEYRKSFDASFKEAIPETIIDGEPFPGACGVCKTGVYIGVAALGIWGIVQSVGTIAAAIPALSQALIPIVVQATSLTAPEALAAINAFLGKAALDNAGNIAGFINTVLSGIAEYICKVAHVCD